MAYEIEFSAIVADHLRALTARQRAMVMSAVEVQLRHEPLIQTRNRKPLRSSILAPWELRVGKLRVFYEVDLERPGVVIVLAVGIKVGNRLLIGKEEVIL